MAGIGFDWCDRRRYTPGAQRARSLVEVVTQLWVTCGAGATSRHSLHSAVEQRTRLTEPEECSRLERLLREVVDRLAPHSRRVGRIDEDRHLDTRLPRPKPRIGANRGRQAEAQCGSARCRSRPQQRAKKNARHTLLYSLCLSLSSHRNDPDERYRYVSSRVGMACDTSPSPAGPWRTSWWRASCCFHLSRDQ